MDGGTIVGLRVDGAVFTIVGATGIESVGAGVEISIVCVCVIDETNGEISIACDCDSDVAWAGISIV